MKSEPYQARFSVGTRVRVVSRAQLEHFQRTWQHHHRLEDAQLAFAGTETIVRTVGFYHGGDVLYELNHVPGIWHEELVHAPDDPPSLPAS